MVNNSKNQSELEEARIIQKAKEGDSDAFGEIYEQNAENIFRFIYSQTSNRLDAEDLTMEVFLKAWRSLSRYENRGFSFSAYLFRIARNIVIDNRRIQNSIIPFIEVEMTNLPEKTITEPDQILTKKAEHQDLFNIMNQLRFDYRMVLSLRFLNDFSTEETSQIMGRSVGAIRVMQHRALAALRKLIPTNIIEY